jgi:hypothetical protein
MALVNSGTDPDLDSEYFDNKRIFILVGHGIHFPVDQSYKLKPNEFYASPTRCGFVTIASDLPWLIFAKSNPRIKIPTPESKSFYTLNYENFPFKKTKSIMSANLDPHTLMPLPGIEFNIETNAFKMYVPFSSKEKTRTIPDEIFQFFSFESKPDLQIRYREFDFNGKKYVSTKLGNYKIGTMTISGILSPNTDTIKFDEEFSYLQDESDKLLLSIGGFNRADIIGMRKIGKEFNEPYPVALPLLFLLPEYGFSESIFNDYSVSDPLLDYCKRVLNLMSSLSVIKIEEFIPNKYSFADVLDTAMQPISKVFEMIRNKFPEDSSKPILLLNPLCRSIMNTPIINTIYNARQEIGNETNIRSITKNTKRYKNFKNKTRRFAAANPNLNKIIPKLYGPVSKKVVNIATVANLTGLPENNIQQFLNSYGNNNIINNLNGTLVKGHRKRRMWCTRKGCRNWFKGFFK